MYSDTFIFCNITIACRTLNSTRSPAQCLYRKYANSSSSLCMQTIGYNIVSSVLHVNGLVSDK